METKKWYEKKLPPNGVLCWVSDRDKDYRYTIELVIEYREKAHIKFYTPTSYYIYATPLTKEEVLERILEVENA